MRRTRRWQSGVAAIATLVVTALVFVSPATANASGSTLRLITEPNSGIGPIDALFAGAKHSVDLVIYELVDARLESSLASDAARGVEVRVLLNRDNEESHNAPAFAYLAAHHVAVRWASDPGIDLTHEKAAVIDGSAALVMTLNLVAGDYASTRDFAVVDESRTEAQAIDRTFIADWNGTPVVPTTAGDLVWSPGAEPALVSLIDGARRTLLVENEEMADPYIIRPLEAAARRGVRVDVVMTASSEWESDFRELSGAGVSVKTYAPSASLYIHAKAIVADAGASDRRAFVGSQNFSITSLVHNRELGITTSATNIVNGLATTIRSDFAGGLPWQIGQ